MIYTSFVSPKVTKKQWHKFKSSVQQEDEEDPQSNYYLPYIPIGVFDNITIMETKEQGKEIFTYQFPRTLENFEFKSTRLHHQKVRSPSWEDLGSKTVPNTIVNTLNSFNHLYVRKFILTYYGKDMLPKWFHDRVLSQYSHISNVWQSFDNGDVVGRISFIQEPGYKLRAVANPVISLQIMLEPLKQFVMNALKVIPQDYCHNQDAAILSISHYLRDDSSHRLSSIDLSDATNNIPLTPQIELLETLLGPKHPQIELFRKVARGKWYVDSPEGETSITFNNGQPLGTGPSFGTFSLFHHFVA
jgi:hypothetical protein